MKYVKFLLVLSCLLVVSEISGQPIFEGDNYDQYSGCIIQKLEIETYDPAGIRIYDTTIFNNAFIMRAINTIHKHTRPQIISRILRFTVGDTVEPFSMYESERLIRRLIEVRDCFIKMKFIPGDKSRVSVVVVVQDRFSLSATGSSNPDFWRAEVRERNLLGRGHRLVYSISGSDSIDPKSSMYFSYAMPILGKHLFQIGGDYCSSTSSGFRGLKFGRPLLSPLMKWGGGLSYGIRYGTIAPLNQLQDQNVLVQQELREAWGGRAVSIGNTANRISNQVIFSGAYHLSKLKLKNPGTTELSSTGNYSESILGSVGYTLLHRFRKKQLFSFEQVSDFTEGISVFLTQGWINKFDNAQVYSGIFVLLAKQFKFGYFAGSGDFGFRTGQNTLPKHALEVKAIYVSPLLEMGRYRLRTTVNGRFLQENNNLGSFQLVADSRSESIWLMNSRILQSLSRASVELRMALYTPWKVYGADLAPFLYLGSSKLSAWSIPEIKGGWRNAIGIGLIIRHVKLAINVLRVSFVFYPGNTIEDHPIYQLFPPQLFELPQTDFEVPQPHTVIGI